MYRDKSKRSNKSEAVEDSSDPGASKCDDYSSFNPFPPFPETQPFDFGGPVHLIILNLLILTTLLSKP